MLRTLHPDHQRINLVVTCSWCCVQ